ncbi:hypothetical protein PBRA_002370 [Plasmodiophora brassicae]|uniref:Uncharacterized protein n=1 Tax=Plasmodiophora brassicae TaxID=37360 RepID=A0A0G4J3J1_PLABS|nr:hypothetical protein PBRA_002370 [Plasmodiophora brassicae]
MAWASLVIVVAVVGVVDRSHASCPPMTYGPGRGQRICSGRAHSCRQTLNGTLTCWGDNSFGQATPVVSSSPALRVACGSRHTCVLHANQTMSCFGDNRLGQSSPPVGSFVDVAAGDTTSCAIATNGSLSCWGSAATQSSVVAPSQPMLLIAPQVYVQVRASSTDAFLALAQDGTMVFFGVSSTGNSVTPTSALFAEVCIGPTHGCGIRQDGSVTCWGGIADIGPSTGAAHLSCGNGFSCAIGIDKTLQCWGPRVVSQPTVTTDYVAVASSNHSTCSITASETTRCFNVF